jgi:hypothetical protein
MSPGSYQDKADASVQAAESEVATTQTTVALLVRDRIFTAYADEVVTASETALSWVGEVFGSVQPPIGMDALRNRTSRVLADAEEAVGHARIAVRRDDQAQLRRAAQELARSASALATADERLR